jgi:hypothetical protein
MSHQWRHLSYLPNQNVDTENIEEGREKTKPVAPSTEKSKMLFRWLRLSTGSPASMYYEATLSTGAVQSERIPHRMTCGSAILLRKTMMNSIIDIIRSSEHYIIFLLSGTLEYHLHRTTGTIGPGKPNLWLISVRPEKLNPATQVIYRCQTRENLRTKSRRGGEEGVGGPYKLSLEFNRVEILFLGRSSQTRIA